jgi:hypothetical protein
MKTFNNLLKKYLTEHGSKLQIEETSVCYEQYIITEKKNSYYIFLNNRIIAHAESLVKAKQTCDTINSGC